MFWTYIVDMVNYVLNCENAFLIYSKEHDVGFLCHCPVSLCFE